MGNDGGVRITRISEIKENWEQVRQELIAETGRQLNKSEDYEIESNADLYDYSKKLPKKLSSRITDENIVKLFAPFQSCDCPFILGDLMFTGEGNYVADDMSILSGALEAAIPNSIYIETWT